MSKGKIPRHNNGLISFDELAPYYPPRRKKIPFGVFADARWKNHHAYYLYPVWNEPHLPEEERDQLRIKFRGKRYNRLMLLKNDEEQLHKDFDIVDPAELDKYAAEASLRDFQIFNQLGLAALSLNIIRHPRRAYSIDNGFSTPGLAHIPREDSLGFFTHKRDEALVKLEKPEVTPESVVVSVIRRYSQYLADQHLAKVTDERMNGHTVIHPFDLPTKQHLRDKAAEMLRSAFPAEEPGKESLPKAALRSKTMKS